MKFFVATFFFAISMSFSHAQYGDEGYGGQGGQGRKGAYGKAVSKQLDNNVTATCKNINNIRKARGLKVIPCGNRLGGKKQQGQDGGFGGDGNNGYGGGESGGYGNY